MLLLDFTKAFGCTQSPTFEVELLWYSRPQAWIQSWLTNRTQQVLLEGKHSRKTVVRSGAPKHAEGTVLCPHCFLLLVNDTGNGICSTLKTFADHILYGLVHKKQDAVQL